MVLKLIVSVNNNENRICKLCGSSTPSLQEVEKQQPESRQVNVTNECIQCDHCDLYFHIECVGVDILEISREEWHCPACK